MLIKYLEEENDKIKAANSYKISIKGYNELGKLINVETIIKN